MAKYSNKEFLEIKSDEDISLFEKEECKIIISDYLSNNDKNKRINAKNANQLFFIIDFLIEYINNKEKLYKDKSQDSFENKNDNLDLVNNINNIQHSNIYQKNIITKKNI